MSVKLQDEVDLSMEHRKGRRVVSANEWYERGVACWSAAESGLSDAWLDELFFCVYIQHVFKNLVVYFPVIVSFEAPIRHVQHHVTAMTTLVTLFLDEVKNIWKSAIQYFYQALSAEQGRDHVLATRIRSSLIKSLTSLGHFLYKREEYTEAEKYYIQVLKFYPEDLVALNQMGMCLSKRKDHIEARRFFKKMSDIAACPKERADAWLNIAYTYREQKNCPRAAEALRTAQRLTSPNDPDVLAEAEALKKLISSVAFSSLFRSQSITHASDCEDRVLEASFYPHQTIM